MSSGRDGTVRVWQVRDDLSVSQMCEVQPGSYTFCRPSACLGHLPEQTSSSPEEACQQPQRTADDDDMQRQGVTDMQQAGSSVPRRAAAASGWYVACIAQDASVIDVWDMRGCQSRVASLAVAATGRARGMCMAVQARPIACHGAAEHALEIISGYEDGSIAYWDTRWPAQPLACIHAHTEPVMCLAMSPGGGQAVSGAADDQLCWWKLQSSPPSPGQAVAMVHHHAATSAQQADVEGCQQLEEVQGQAAQRTMKRSKQMTINSSGLADVAYRPDGRLLASAGWDGKVRLFSTKRKEPLAVLRYHTGQATSVCFAPSINAKGLLASASRDHTVALWHMYA
eukprot:CAMPEP_0202910420 /NCGR_PEP_ID=MMETSP1392-20130828/52023_1 /ASSEMBLY_ACC=CAM_ASM_000868 /TAXON_ID=225041 /ORGANISM="Chlamydomonas chlamydogama, Strain SAG 11-48b" /LENGTH=339 /DNA_ID=CAMNT_0049600527 /DNA_START=167 /DNA_END=1186 /DNA_ORIENTATION=-